jgi:hypothetical protein
MINLFRLILQHDVYLSVAFGRFDVEEIGVFISHFIRNIRQMGCRGEANISSLLSLSFLSEKRASESLERYFFSFPLFSIVILLLASCWVSFVLRARAQSLFSFFLSLIRSSFVYVQCLLVFGALTLLERTSTTTSLHISYLFS